MVGLLGTQAAAYLNTTTGMYVTRAGSILKTDIRWSHAHEGGANQTIRKDLIRTMHKHTSMPDGNQALREGIRRSSRDFDGVGQSII